MGSPVFLRLLFPLYKRRPKLADIDEDLHPLVRDMWKQRYITLTCCSGHGKTIGYILFLPPTKRRFRTAQWKVNEPVPQKVSELYNIKLASVFLTVPPDGLGPSPKPPAPSNAPPWASWSV